MKVIYDDGVHVLDNPTKKSFVYSVCDAVISRATNFKYLSPELAERRLKELTVIVNSNIVKTGKKSDSVLFQLVYDDVSPWKIITVKKWAAIK